MNGGPGPSRIARFAMAAAWSSFLAAGVLELLVFAVVDPGELRWFGATPVALSVQAVYTVGFLIFWGVSALGASLALLLASLPADEVRPAARAPGWPR
ncbi:hypothetical protein [Roseateles sp.]|uniref:hypothetical protein n=1 Tax=Roseateles sp. TaxID=1971397 RepID=UPI0025DD73F1|nr:hypothetical protein [Roseateles sp.]